MADKEKVSLPDLFKKHKGKELYNGFYTVGKRIYQDDSEIISKSIALDKESLEVLRAKIMAVLNDELSPKKKSSINTTNQKKSRQTKLL